LPHRPDWTKRVGRDRAFHHSTPVVSFLVNTNINTTWNLSIEGGS
jgi:hypothetical protein